MSTHDPATRKRSRAPGRLVVEATCEDGTRVLVPLARVTGAIPAVQRASGYVIQSEAGRGLERIVLGLTRGGSRDEKPPDRNGQKCAFHRRIDLISYSRKRDKLCEELTLAKIERHTEAVDELDEEGILPRALDLCPGITRLQTEASAAVLPRRNRARRKSVQSNCRNGRTFQLLGAGSEW